MKRRNGASPPASTAGVARSHSSRTEPVRLVSTAEHSAGFAGYDDLGRPCWNWMDEPDPATDAVESGDMLKALESPTLSLADEPGAAPARRAGKAEGYDPYDTVEIKVGNRFRRR